MIGSIHWLMQIWNNKGETKTCPILEPLFPCVRSWSTHWPLWAPAGSSQKEIYGPAYKDFITARPLPHDPYVKCFTSAMRLISTVFLCVTSCENHFLARGQSFHVSSIFLLRHIKDVLSFFHSGGNKLIWYRCFMPHIKCIMFMFMSYVVSREEKLENVDC